MGGPDSEAPAPCAPPSRPLMSLQCPADSTGRCHSAGDLGSIVDSLRLATRFPGPRLSGEAFPGAACLLFVPLERLGSPVQVCSGALPVQRDDAGASSVACPVSVTVGSWAHPAGRRPGPPESPLWDRPSGRIHLSDITQTCHPKPELSFRSMQMQKSLTFVKFMPPLCLSLK